MNPGILAAAALLSLTLATTPSASGAAPTVGHRSDGPRGVIVWTLADAPDENGHLVIARADGSRQRELTPVDPDVNDIDAVLSPDGRTVLFERDTNGGESAELRIVPIRGGSSSIIDVGCTGSCLGVGMPTWLTGRRIAWTRWDAGDHYPEGFAGTLYTGILDDGQVTRVRRLSPDGPDGVYEDAYARRMPDGRSVVFQRYQISGSHQGVFRMRNDRTRLRQLTPWELDADLPRPSPAKAGPTRGLVVFQTYGEGNPTGTSRDLATVPGGCRSLEACSAAIRYVTHNGLGEGRASNPAWSPDGSRIAYAGRVSADVVDAEIVTIRYDGTDPRTVSTSPLFDYRPDWGPARG